MAKEIAYDLFSGTYVEGNWTEEEKERKRIREAADSMLAYFFSDMEIAAMYERFRKHIEAQLFYGTDYHSLPKAPAFYIERPGLEIKYLWFDEASEVPEAIWNLPPPKPIPHWQVLNGGDKPLDQSETETEMTYTPQEQRKHREELVAALRSGEYKQAKGVLRKDNKLDQTNSFCCLGVGCEISGLGKWTMGHQLEKEVDQPEYWYYIVGDNESWSGLPLDVMDYYGIATSSGAFDGAPASINGLAAKNDDDYDFTAIADLIESEPVGMLTVKAATWRD